MNTNTARLAACVALLWSGSALAQMPQPSPYAPYTPYPGQTPSPYAPYPGQPDVTAKNPLLLALVVQPLLQQSGGAVASGVGRLFTRLFDALLGRTSASSVPSPNTPGAPGYMAGMPTPYGQPPPYGSTYPTTTYPSGMPGAPGSYQPGTMGAYPSAGTSPPAYGTQAPGMNPTGPTSPYGSAPPGSYPTGMTTGYPNAATTGYGTPPVNTTMPPGTSTGMTMPGVPPGMSPSSPSPGGYMPGTATMPVPNTQGAPALPTTGTPNTMMPSSPTAMPSGAMPSPPSYGAAAPGSPMTAGTPAYPPGMAGAPTTAGPQPATAPGMPPMSPVPGNKAVVLPSVVYSLDELDPKKFSTKRHIKISKEAVPSLRTGDVFAIEYSTNLPGQLHIDNIDSAGKTAELGTYVMAPGRDNRIPITKGIKLVGETGTETFKMYFFPCASEGAVGKAAEGLPICPTGPSPQLLQASRHHVGAKGAVNLDSPDPTIAVAAVTDYQPNDVMVNEFRINHIAPDAAADAR